MADEVVGLSAVDAHLSTLLKRLFVVDEVADNAAFLRCLRDMGFGAHSTLLSVRTLMLSSAALTYVPEWYEEQSKKPDSGVSAFHKALPVAAIQQLQLQFKRLQALQDRDAAQLSQPKNTAVPQPPASSGSGAGLSSIPKVSQPPLTDTNAKKGRVKYKRPKEDTR
jgi:hypothetical protein